MIAYFGLILGDTEFILDLKTYVHSVVATQTCEVYTLDWKNYDRLVVRKNPKTIDMIREGAEMKLRCRMERLQADTLPLLRALTYKLRSNNRTVHPKRKEAKTPLFAAKFSDIVPQRGAIIDLFGPGTIFYRNRMRERARNKAMNRADNFRGASVGFGLRLQQNVVPVRAHTEGNLLSVPAADNDHGKPETMISNEDNSLFLTGESDNVEAIDVPESPRERYA